MPSIHVRYCSLERKVKVFIKARSLKVIHLAIFSVSILFLLWSFMMVLIKSSLRLNAAIEQEMLFAKLNTIVLTALFSAICSLSLSIKSARSYQSRISIKLIEPLIGVLFYILLVLSYFYDQIVWNAKWMRVLTEPFGIHFVGEHIFRWQDSDLLAVRFTQTLVSSWLVFYGFFAAMIGVKQIPLYMILLTVLMLVLLLLLLHKVFAVHLSVLLLFIIPFGVVKLLREHYD